MPSTHTSYMASAISLLCLFSATADASHRPIRRHPMRSDTRLDQRQAPALQDAGCYSSFSSASGTPEVYTWQSHSHCQTVCGDNSVLGLTGGDTCACSNELPPKSKKVDDSKCSKTCTGWTPDNCGGAGYYHVYFTGDPTVAGGSSSSSSSQSSTSSDSSDSSTSPTSTSASTTAAQTVVVTAPGQTTTSPSDNDSSKPTKHHNTAGIAAGVVVGVIAAAALFGGGFFFLRRRKQQKEEAEHRRNAQVNEFMREHRAATQAPNSAYSGTTNDSRLEPQAGARRNSVGSIADTEDFSRRILRVANPDR